MLHILEKHLCIFAHIIFHKYVHQKLKANMVCYEAADLAVHPSPRTAKGGFNFSYRCLVFRNKFLKEKPAFFGVIQVKGSKNVFFKHIHSDPILIIVTFFYINE